MSYLKPPAPLCRILKKAPWQVRREALKFKEKTGASTVLCDLPTLKTWNRHTEKTRAFSREEITRVQEKPPAITMYQRHLTREIQPPESYSDPPEVEMTVEEVNDISGFNLEIFEKFDVPASAESLIEDLEVFSLPVHSSDE